MLDQKFKSYEENIKSYLAANNELLTKIINDLNGKLTDLQASVKHSDKVNLEKFKGLDGDVSHINGTFRIHAKKRRRSIIRKKRKSYAT